MDLIRRGLKDQHLTHLVDAFGEGFSLEMQAGPGSLMATSWIKTMNTEQTPLPYPTNELVHSFIQQFDQTYSAVESALGKMFRLFPNNTLLEDVILKVVVLNDLYRTNIWATYQVADHICTLNIDHLLAEGKPEAVDMIAYVRLGDKTRNNYSFASKYCAWHNPSAYPIYDSFVDRILWEYRKQDRFDTFLHQDLLKYHRFRQTIINFQRHYQLTAYHLKDIDKFLWIAGKKYFPVSYG